MTATTGIIYLLTGPRPAERLLVSVASLRRHYSGPVTIMCSREESAGVAKKIADTHGVAVQRFTDAGTYRHATYVTKPRLIELSPYDSTIYLDADTLVVDDPSPLLDTDRPLTITTFSDWVSQGRIISSRVSQWLKVSPMAKYLAEVQLARRWPAINTGIFAWHRGWRWSRLWIELTEAGRSCSFTDELSMQILTGEMCLKRDYRLLDARWNYSPIYPVKGISPAIYHFHGSKHLRKDAGDVIWWPEFLKAWEANTAGIREWAGSFGDKDLRDRLKKIGK